MALSLTKVGYAILNAVFFMSKSFMYFRFLFSFIVYLSLSTQAQAQPETPLAQLVNQSHNMANIEYLPSMGCMIEPSMKIDISSPVTGVVSFLKVSLGDKVQKGSVLFTLNSRIEAASVELAKVREEFAQRQVERNETLYQDQLISNHERDEFITEYQVAQKERGHSEAVLAMRTVKSPINGVVIDRYSDPGEFVGTDPLLSLASLDPLKIELVMPYESFGLIPSSGQIIIYPDPPVNGEYPANITVVDPIIDSASGTFRIRMELPNPKGLIPAGIKCRAALKKP